MMLAVALLSVLKRVEVDSRMSPDPLQSKLFPLTKLNSVSLGYSWNHNHLDVLADLLVEFSKVFDPILAFYFEVGFHTFVSAFSADNNFVAKREPIIGLTVMQPDLGRKGTPKNCPCPTPRRLICGYIRTSPSLDYHAVFSIYHPPLHSLTYYKAN
jgi:hypothetical protein